VIALNNYISQLIPAAITLSAAAYLVRFFGKVIADQKAFSDDRNWEIELSGVGFLFNLVLIPGVLGLALSGWFSTYQYIGHWGDFIVLGVLGAYSLLQCSLLSQKNYQIRMPIITLWKTVMAEDNLGERLLSSAERIGRLVPLFIFPFIFALVSASEYRSNSPIWFIITLTDVFFALILLATHSSLATSRPPKVRLIFRDSDQPQEVLLLKANEDNIRVRTNDRIMIIPKDRIKSIELDVPEQLRES